MINLIRTCRAPFARRTPKDYKLPEQEPGNTVMENMVALNKMAMERLSPALKAKNAFNSAMDTLLANRQGRKTFISQDIPEQIWLSPQQLQRMEALGSNIDQNIKNQMNQVADCVLKLQLPTLMHYIVSTEPQKMVVYPEKELNAEEVKQISSKINKPQFQTIKLHTNVPKIPRPTIPEILEKNRRYCDQKRGLNVQERAAKRAAKAAAKAQKLAAKISASSAAKGKTGQQKGKK